MPFDGAFSTTHWLIVGFVALLVFPSKELPEVARKAGVLLRQFNQYRAMLRGEVHDLVGSLDRAVRSDDAPQSAADGVVLEAEQRSGAGPVNQGPQPAGSDAMAP